MEFASEWRLRMIYLLQVPCGCAPHGMGGERTRPIWTVLILLLTERTRAMCPARCQCNDDLLQVSCISAGLEVFPIQLNPAVRNLDLHDNKINNIHYFLNNYNNLESLDLSKNKLQTLGSMSFETQVNLKELNLSGNEVQNLTKESLKGLRVLSELDLSFNRLEELSKNTFHELHSLEILRLRGNQIVFMPEEIFKPVKLLRELYLDDNQLLRMPGPAIVEGLDLQLLSLSQNLIESIEEDDVPFLPELRVLLLNGNVINDIHPGALSGLTSLEHLDLSDNNFTFVPTASLAKLSNLTKLQFSGNFIKAVPPVAFRGLFQLRFLHLDRLEVLKQIDSRAFVDNINVERVWLDDNIAISSIPTRMFHGNPRVTHISIKNNQLVTLEASHFPLDQLIRLELSGNPFRCNCSLLWLWRLKEEQRSRAINNTDSAELTVDVENSHCAGPEPLEDVPLADVTESQLGCSISWIAAASIVAFLCFVLTTVFSVIYYSSVKRRLKEREMTPRESARCSNGGGSFSLSYGDPAADKYIIGSALVHEYRALPQWTYSKSDAEIYNQYDNNIPGRAHIVYV